MTTTKPSVLQRAVDDVQSAISAADLEAYTRAAVRAVLPGRQQAKNLGPMMELARKAVARAVRRRHRAAR